MPEVYVKFNSLEEAMQAIRGAAPAPANNHAPAPAPQAPAPQAPAPQAPAPQAPAPQAPAQGGNVTLAQVQQAVQAYADAHGPVATKAKFAEVGGATKISDIPEANYPLALQVFAL
jgi:hypothetical protein